MACGTSLKPETLASCQKQRPCTLISPPFQGPKRLISPCASNWSGNVPFGLDNRLRIPFFEGRCAKRPLDVLRFQERFARATNLAMGVAFGLTLRVGLSTDVDANGCGGEAPNGNG